MKNLPNFLLGFTDRHLTQSDVREFLLKEYELLRDSSADRELTKLTALLARLGWMESESVAEEEFGYSDNEINDAINWMERFGSNDFIKSGVAVVSAGMNLDILDAFDSQMEWVRVQAQRLLQHVESRRSKSLTNFTTEINVQQIFTERTTVSVFFSRYARRHSDLRFINTAFKLNEWLIMDYRQIKEQDLKLRFLMALAEQENSAKELLT